MTILFAVPLWQKKFWSFTFIDNFNDIFSLSYLLTNLSRLIQTKVSNKNDCKKVCYSYILIKLLSICLILVNTLLIHLCLGIDIYSFISSQFYEYYETDRRGVESAYFPLKSVCIFRIRELTTTNSYAVVCSLPINLFIQFSFSILSVWFLILFAFNLTYLLKWWSLFERRKQLDYVEHKLARRLRSIANKGVIKPSCFSLDHRGDRCLRCKTLVNRFFDSFLTSDFLFLLRIISINSNSSILIENILVYFWKIFIDFIKVREKIWLEL